MSNNNSHSKKVFGIFGVQIVTNNPLTIALLFLQGISLVTTIEGAGIIFPEAKVPIPFVELNLSLVLGFTIQFMLVIFLLFGSAKEHSNIRRKIAILVLAIFSTYTSFFSIYNGLSGGILNEESNISQALERHNKLKDIIYTPHSKYLNDVRKKKEEIKEEINGERASAAKGCVQECQKLKRELEKLEQQITDKKLSFLYEIEENFKTKRVALEKKGVRGIYRDDKEALSKVPPEFKKDVPQDEYDNENDYFQETSYFLVPYKKVIQEKNPDAIVAFIIASSIDGMSLVLGGIKSRIPFFKSIAVILGSIIVGNKRLKRTLINWWKQYPEPFDSWQETQDLRDIVGNIKLDREAKCSGSVFFAYIL